MTDSFLGGFCAKLISICTLIIPSSAYFAHCPLIKPVSMHQLRPRRFLHNLRDNFKASSSPVQSVQSRLVTTSHRQPVPPATPTHHHLPPPSPLRGGPPRARARVRMRAAHASRIRFSECYSLLLFGKRRLSRAEPCAIYTHAFWACLSRYVCTCDIHNGRGAPLDKIRAVAVATA